MQTITDDLLHFIGTYCKNYETTQINLANTIYEAGISFGCS
jgi:hypothetical protein